VITFTLISFRHSPPWLGRTGTYAGDPGASRAFKVTASRPVFLSYHFKNRDFRIAGALVFCRAGPSRALRSTGLKTRFSGRRGLKDVAAIGFVVDGAASNTLAEYVDDDRAQTRHRHCASSSTRRRGQLRDGAGRQSRI